MAKPLELEQAHERAIRAGIAEFCGHWPAFNRWWREANERIGFSDRHGASEVPIEPFERFVAAYTKTLRSGEAL